MLHQNAWYNKFAVVHFVKRSMHASLLILVSIGLHFNFPACVCPYFVDPGMEELSLSMNSVHRYPCRYSRPHIGWVAETLFFLPARLCSNPRLMTWNQHTGSLHQQTVHGLSLHFECHLIVHGFLNCGLRRASGPRNYPTWVERMVFERALLRSWPLTSVSLPTNTTGPLYDYFSGAN